MENRTGNFIDVLKGLSDNDEIIERAINEVGLLKDTLQKRGYKFYTVEHTDDLVGGQGILNRDRDLVEYYKEVAYIKKGTISEKWVSMLDEQERYNEIRDVMRDILYK